MNSCTENPSRYGLKTRIRVVNNYIKMKPVKYIYTLKHPKMLKLFDFYYRYSITQKYSKVYIYTICTYKIYTYI